MATPGLSIILRILDNENRLSERADQKSISMLSILGVFMVFFIAYYRIITINIFTVIMVMLYFLFAILTIFNLVMAIKPRLRKEKTGADKPACDPTFFTDICAFPDYAAYKEALQIIMKDEPSVIDIYTREIYNVARINSEKYMYVRRGMFTAITTIAIELAIISYLFIFYMGEGVMPPIR